MMQPVVGMPYVPGLARGVLRRDPCDGGIWFTTQSELGNLGTARPAGAVVVNAAPFSHAMIALLARGVPTVLLDRMQAAALREGEEILLDAAAGRILAADAAPAPRASVPAAPPAGKPVHTADNVAVELRASVRDAAGARRASENGACAIGLVRSEFLVPPGAAMPDADFYEQALAAVCEAAKPLPVVVRLLDIAPDKRPPWLASVLESTGALGLQGARLFDTEPVAGVVQAQLEATARLQRRIALRLLVPYVGSASEMRRRREAISTHLPKPLLIGAMIETPAAALEIGEFCDVADFVALGTNDLMQCLFGADRDLPAVSQLLDPYSPALYRFLHTVAENAGPQLIRVQMCGVLSQLPGTMMLLLGLGYRVFSVDPVFIPWLAETVRHTDTTHARELATRVRMASSADTVKQLLAGVHP